MQMEDDAMLRFRKISMSRESVNARALTEPSPNAGPQLKYFPCTYPYVSITSKTKEKTTAKKKQKKKNKEQNKKTKQIKHKKQNNTRQKKQKEET